MPAGFSGNPQTAFPQKCGTRKDYIGALELSRKAFDLAEKVFQPAALRAVIENAISGRQLAEALQELQKYLEYFPGAADRSTILLLAGNLNVHLNNFPAQCIVLSLHGVRG